MLKFAGKLLRLRVIFACKEDVACFTSVDGREAIADRMLELCSTQEEADTRMILHILHIAETTPNTIIVRSPDTDVFVLLLYNVFRIANDVLFDTCVGNKRRLIDVKAEACDLGEGICRALPSFQSFTGCDTSSAFVRKGKVKPVKFLQRRTSFISTFQDIGKYLDLSSEETSKHLESFTCLMYGGRLFFTSI